MADPYVEAMRQLKEEGKLPKDRSPSKQQAKANKGVPDTSTEPPKSKKPKDKKAKKTTAPKTPKATPKAVPKPAAPHSNLPVLKGTPKPILVGKGKSTHEGLHRHARGLEDRARARATGSQPAPSKPAPQTAAPKGAPKAPLPTTRTGKAIRGTVRAVSTTAKTVGRVYRLGKGLTLLGGGIEAAGAFKRNVPKMADEALRASRAKKHLRTHAVAARDYNVKTTQNPLTGQVRVIPGAPKLSPKAKPPKRRYR